MVQQAKNHTPKALCLKEAAAYSGFPVRTLRNLIYDRRLRVVQLAPSGKIFIPVSELDRLLAQETRFISFMTQFDFMHTGGR